MNRWKTLAVKFTLTFVNRKNVTWSLPLCSLKKMLTVIYSVWLLPLPRRAAPDSMLRGLSVYFYILLPINSVMLAVESEALFQIRSKNPFLRLGWILGSLLPSILAAALAPSSAGISNMACRSIILVMMRGLSSFTPKNWTSGSGTEVIRRTTSLPYLSRPLCAMIHFRNASRFDTMNLPVFRWLSASNRLVLKN